MTSDDHKGLKSAIERHFQGASWQRCQVHFARNLLGKVGFGECKELAEGLRGVFAATSKGLALRATQELADRWQRTHPKVADIEECLSCLAFPEGHRLRLRTTTATITTIDLGGLYSRSWGDESLLRRPTPEGSRGRRAARYLQVRGRPPVRHKPLLGQALHKTRLPRRAPYPKEGRRKTSHSGRHHEEALGGGHTLKALSHHQGEAPLPHELRQQEPQRSHLEETAQEDGLLQKKRSVGALERDEWQRAAWRVRVAQSLDARSLVFVDEMGTNTSLSPIYGWSKKGQRAYGSVPRNRGKNTTVLASMSVVEGMGPSLAVEGVTNANVFERYVERVLAPTLRRAQVVIMDNLSAHKGERVSGSSSKGRAASLCTYRLTRRTSIPSRRLSAR